MRKRDVQALDLSVRFGDFGGIVSACPRPDWRVVLERKDAANFFSWIRPFLTFSKISPYLHAKECISELPSGIEEEASLFCKLIGSSSSALWMMDVFEAK